MFFDSHERGLSVKNNPFAILVLLLLIFYANMAHAKLRSIAVLGDGINTGMGAAETFSLDSDEFLESMLNPSTAASNQSRSISRPIIVPNDIRELQNPIGWVVTNFITVASNLYLNSPENSWVSFVGKKLSINPDRIYVAARNMEGSEDAILQANRLLAHTGGLLPDLVILFFSRGDVCGLFPKPATLPEDYGNGIYSALRYLFKNSKSDQTRGAVLLGSGLNLIQNVKEDRILSKTTERYGESVSCGSMRDSSYKIPRQYQAKSEAAVAYSDFLPPNPKIWCPALYDKNRAKPEALVSLATKMKAYRNELQDVQKKLQKELLKGEYPGFEAWQIVLTKSSSDLEFNADDIAKDCFNLSPKGHKRLGDEIFKDFVSKIKL